MSMTKRNASLGDAALLLEWRNSPSARKFSQKSELIQVKDHLVWLTGRLERVIIEPFFVFELEHRLVGMSRLDFELHSAKQYAISLMVDPNEHGKGIGTTILNLTCENFFDLHPESTIVARVHRNNSVSQKLFTKAGFELQKSVSDFLYLEKTR